MTHVIYASAIGSLMYAVYTRLDLSQAVLMVSIYMHNPDMGSMEGSKVDSTVHQRYHRHCFGVREGFYR